MIKYGFHASHEQIAPSQLLRDVQRAEQAGFDVTCEEISHDFGQPVDSRDEAVAYAMRQLRLEEHQRPRLEERIMFHAEEVDGQLVLPIKRFNCLLRFTR